MYRAARREAPGSRRATARRWPRREGSRRARTTPASRTPPVLLVPSRLAPAFMQLFHEVTPRAREPRVRPGQALADLVTALPAQDDHALAGGAGLHEQRLSRGETQAAADRRRDDDLPPRAQPRHVARHPHKIP